MAEIHPDEAMRRILAAAMAEADECGYQICTDYRIVLESSKISLVGDSIPRHVYGGGDDKAGGTTFVLHRDHEAHVVGSVATVSLRGAETPTN